MNTTAEEKAAALAARRAKILARGEARLAMLRGEETKSAATTDNNASNDAAEVTNNINSDETNEAIESNNKETVENKKEEEKFIETNNQKDNDDEIDYATGSKLLRRRKKVTTTSDDTENVDNTKTETIPAIIKEKEEAKNTIIKNPTETNSTTAVSSTAPKPTASATNNTSAVSLKETLSRTRRANKFRQCDTVISALIPVILAVTCAILLKRCGWSIVPYSFSSSSDGNSENDEDSIRNLAASKLKANTRSNAAVDADIINEESYENDMLHTSPYRIGYAPDSNDYICSALHMPLLPLVTICLGLFKYSSNKITTAMANAAMQGSWIPQLSTGTTKSASGSNPAANMGQLSALFGANTGANSSGGLLSMALKYGPKTWPVMQFMSGLAKDASMFLFIYVLIAGFTA